MLPAAAIAFKDLELMCNLRVCVFLVHDFLCLVKIIPTEVSEERQIGDVTKDKS